MDMTSEVIELGVRLAESAARNTATAVADKVRTLRASAKKDEAISGLEEIINNLIADKSELTRIAQSYQAELVSQRLNAGDVKYITDTVFPSSRTSSSGCPATKARRCGNPSSH
ncbi:hypothetical protein [Leifsonia xyli]|uniref:hypothetical protein n=1 Tax=Leifsonia xyli TaxID=1575 RepID=UPI003D66E38C